MKTRKLSHSIWLIATLWNQHLTFLWEEHFFRIWCLRTQALMTLQLALLKRATVLTILTKATKCWNPGSFWMTLVILPPTTTVIFSRFWKILRTLTRGLWHVLSLICLSIIPDKMIVHPRLRRTLLRRTKSQIALFSRRMLSTRKIQFNGALITLSGLSENSFPTSTGRKYLKPWAK